MYFFEHLAYLVSSGQLNKELPLERVKELQADDKQIEDGLNACGNDYEAYRKSAKGFTSLTQSVPGAEPSDMRCIYNRTDTVLDVRTPFDEWRGLATFVFCLGIYVLVEYWIYFGVQVFNMINGSFKLGTDSIAGLAFAMTLASILYGIGTWLFFRYALRWFRLEVFTQRRLIVRFNRRTRKVWLHRPPSCGGIVALDWDKSFPGAADSASPDKVTAPVNAILWIKGHGSDISTGVFLGRFFGTDKESSALWEYIRRFMEQDPQSLPPFTWRERLSKFPWPWMSLYAPWSFFMPLLKRVPALWVLFILLTPILLVWGASHWVSLLLCWEPRFPKEAD